MIALLVALTLGQATPCADGPALIAAGSERAAVFDLDGAVARLGSRTPGCPETEIAFSYVRGLVAARDAYRYGGSPESLAPVGAAIAELARHAPMSPSAEIARVMLLAASAAAQSERDEMALLLDHALQLERQERAAGRSGAPMVTAHEVAGDLWLQVHRFEDARQAYARAEREVGRTRRITLGVARTASRLDEVPTACREFRLLVEGWSTTTKEPSELAEARAFLARLECRESGRAGPVRQ